jgi:hypothetical protein
MKCAAESGHFQFCESANLQPGNSSSLPPIVGHIGFPKSIQGQTRARFANVQKCRSRRVLLVQVIVNCAVVAA